MQQEDTFLLGQVFHDYICHGCPIDLTDQFQPHLQALLSPPSRYFPELPLCFFSSPVWIHSSLPNGCSWEAPVGCLHSTMVTFSSNFFHHKDLSSIEQLQPAHVLQPCWSFVKSSSGLCPLETFFITVMCHFPMGTTGSFKKPEFQLCAEAGSTRERLLSPQFF